MIEKPKLKPRAGMVEVEYMQKRMYKDIKTGEIIDPDITIDYAGEQTEEETMTAEAALELLFSEDDE